MSDESENGVKCESLLQGNDGQTLDQTVTKIVESLLDVKLSDFKKEIKDEIKDEMKGIIGNLRQPARKPETASGDEPTTLYERRTETVETSSNHGLSYWRERADEELKNSKQTQLKNLSGMHTVFCIDTSNSMNEGEAWEQTKTFFKDYLSGIEEENMRKRKHHNTALVTFGKETIVQERLTKDLKSLEQKLDEIVPQGPSPLLAGLLMAKAAATVSNFSFAMVNYMPIPPRIIVITDGKATDVNTTAEDEIESHEKGTDLQQQIIAELKEIRKEDIEVHFVYVGDPDIAFLHDLCKASGGDLLAPTAGKKMAKMILFKCILKTDEDFKTKKEEQRRKTEKQDPSAGVMRSLSEEEPIKVGPDSDTSDEESDSKSLADIFGDSVKQDIDIKPLKLLGKIIKGLEKAVDFYKEDKDMQKFAPIGSRVKRGQDWMWGNQDHGGTGTIIGHSVDESKKYWCWVEWDFDGEINAYRWNLDGKFDLTVVKDLRIPRNGKTFDVGSRVVPGNDFKGDKKHGEGVVIKIKDDNIVQVRWNDDGSRADLCFGKDGSPEEIKLAEHGNSDQSEQLAPGISETDKTQGTGHGTTARGEANETVLPPLPKDAELVDVRENTARLLWQHGTDTNGDPVSYVVTYREKSNTRKSTVIKVFSSERSCLLDELKSDTEYVTEIQAVQKVSETEALQSIIFTTAKTLEEEDPRILVIDITPKDASHLSSAIGKNWEQLGPALGVGEVPISPVKYDNMTTASRIYQMMLTWIEKSEDHTWGTFLKHLRECKSVSVIRTAIREIIKRNVKQPAASK